MSKRLFVAIDLPDSTRQLLADLDPDIRGVRWTELGQMHLTLGFSGTYRRFELKLREKLSAIEFGAFFLPVNGVGVFSSKGAVRKLTGSASQSAPASVRKFTSRVAGSRPGPPVSKPELRPWHPLITIARCRNVSRSSGPEIPYNRMPSSTQGMIPSTMRSNLYSADLTPAGPIHTRELTLHCSSRFLIDRALL
jgi:2'-5' RNA ligase